MTVKRRNHGRNKHGRGHVKRVRCVSTSKLIPKDKAVKRFVVRSVVVYKLFRRSVHTLFISGVVFGAELGDLRPSVFLIFSFSIPKEHS